MFFLVKPIVEAFTILMVIVFPVATDNVDPGCNKARPIGQSSLGTPRDTDMDCLDDGPHSPKFESDKRKENNNTAKRENRPSQKSWYKRHQTAGQGRELGPNAEATNPSMLTS